MRKLDDLHAAPDGVVVSARVGSPTSASSRRTGGASRSRRVPRRRDRDAEATWFGRRFIERRLHPGDELIVSGRLKHRGFGIVFDDPEFQKADAANLLHVGRIVPVYRLTAGLTAARLRQAMREALDKAGYAYPEYLPPGSAPPRTCPPIAEALEHAHYPTSFEARDAALRRLAFDELLALQLGMVGAPAGAGAGAHGRDRGVRGPRSRGPRRARGVARTQARPRGAAHRRPGDVDRRDPRRPRAARPDAPARPGRRRVGQDRRRRMGARRGGARRPPGALLAPTDLLARQHGEHGRRPRPGPRASP